MPGAKEHLVDLQWKNTTGNVSRFGELFVINPIWDRLISLANRELESSASESESEGRGDDPGTNLVSLERPSEINSAGVSLIKESPSEKSQYQDENLGFPNKPGPGFFKSNSEKGKPQDRKDSPPRLSHIRPKLDFPNTGRCLELLRQAVKCGLMPNACEHSRLLWMAAIERARTVEAKNPAGVFLVLVKKKLWKNLSEGQFDAANKRIKEHLYSLPREMPPFFEPRSMSEARKPATLSKDAQLVKVVRTKLGNRVEERLVFHALRTHAGFTKERYDAAVLELNAPQPAASGFSLAFSSCPSVPSSLAPSLDAGGEG